MECMYCGAELDWYDSYGNKDYIIYGNMNGKRGDIYKCPNHEGFNSVEEVMEYLNMNYICELNDYLTKNELDGWEDVVCESGMHSVSGSFYTDINDDLHEGYPC
ncbi:hypothetical protein [Terrisporobacter sp.]|uniref:hypothetical protein n=1 Tax=Terrisporobacter sp. TaxID=1965305 RepID=UPI0028A2DCB0|nr:hypothetical protein [Terrisporobacter sp.]